MTGERATGAPDPDPPERAGGWVHRALGVIAYPAAMTATLALAATGLARAWPVALVVGAAGLAGGALVLLLERLVPYRRRWQRSHGDVGTDLCHVLVSGPVVQALGALLAGGVTLVGAWLSARLGVTLWPSRWPPWAQLPLALLVSELGGYWLHRLEHERPLLWRLHAVHHSVPRLYFLNALRVHPLDSLLTIGLTMIPLVLLGAPEPTLALFAAYASTHMLLQHSNVDVRLGPLNWVFSMAEVHRWHHSPHPTEMSANYGGVLLVWDVVFRTRWFPRDRVVEPELVVGIPEIPDYPKGYLGQLLSPFRARLWRRPG